MNSLRQEHLFRTSIVVPCFNEAKRLDPDCFVRFVERHPGFTFLFVNDGSTDETLDRLKTLQIQHPDWCELLDLETNQGKAEAVRQGMLRASSSGPEAIGYLDADLATPLDALPRMVDTLRRHPETSLVLGTRLRLQGHRIEREEKRRILGRGFALVASWTLGFSIVDTQCGAKLFRTTPEIKTLFAEPFRSRWIFDVEILARLQQRLGRERAAQRLYELPLESWQEIPGSKLKSTDFFRAVGELAGNFWQYRLRPGFKSGPSATPTAPHPTSSPAMAHEDSKKDRRAA